MSSVGVSAGSGRVLSDLPPPGRPNRWADFRLRLLSGLVLAPFCLACLWVGGPVWVVLLLLALAVLLGEWRRLGRGRWWFWPGVVFYLVLPAFCLFWLRRDPAVGRANLLFLLGTVWASDVGAYCVGRLAGGPKLAPSISPGKTWTGALGGLAAALLVAEGAAGWGGGGPVVAGLVGLALGVVAQAGDLFESWAKRQAAVKDSGRLIPGHGGLLDRVDALLAVALASGAIVLVDGRGVFLWR